MGVAVQRCPRCRRHFSVLDDEVGDHACPACGYEPRPAPTEWVVHFSVKVKAENEDAALDEAVGKLREEKFDYDLVDSVELVP